VLLFLVRPSKQLIITGGVVCQQKSLGAPGLDARNQPYISKSRFMEMQDQFERKRRLELPRVGSNFTSRPVSVVHDTYLLCYTGYWVT